MSREMCGCQCKVYCDPDTCQCAQAGIKCQVGQIIKFLQNSKIPVYISFELPQFHGFLSLQQYFFKINKLRNHKARGLMLLSEAYLRHYCEGEKEEESRKEY